MYLLKIYFDTYTAPQESNETSRAFVNNRCPIIGAWGGLSQEVLGLALGFVTPRVHIRPYSQVSLAHDFPRSSKLTSNGGHF